MVSVLTSVPFLVILTVYVVTCVSFLAIITVYVLTCVPFLAISTNVLTKRVSSLSPTTVFLANVATFIVGILISYFLRLKLLIGRPN